MESTLSIMLDLNDETAQLLDWTVNVCYSKAAPVAAKCFRALVMLFSKRLFCRIFVVRSLNDHRLTQCRVLSFIFKRNATNLYAFALVYKSACIR